MHSTSTPAGLPQPEESWRDRPLLIELLVTVAALALTLVLFSKFILFVESRSGVVLPDPVLASFAARDFTVPIFAIIYGAILLAIVTLARHPRALLVTIRAYTLLVLVRIAVMYTIPLEPPAGMITLVDPIYSLGPGAIITRDLFFSGHTATMFLLFLTARRPWVRNIFLACTFAMGVLVLWQHCHYTVDVLAAPFFAYGCYRGARYVIGT
jgi:PAP2 superfamily C-terminal